MNFLTVPNSPSLQGYFRMQRDTMQMGVFGGYFACYNKDCTVDP